MNLILMIETVIVMNERMMEIMGNVSRSSRLFSNLTKIRRMSGRLLQDWIQNWKYASIDASMIRARVTVI